MNRTAPLIRNRDGKLVPVRCQYDKIQPVGVFDRCINPADAGNGVMLCFTHARVIGYEAGLDKPSRIRNRHDQENGLLTAENTRLRERILELTSPDRDSEPEVEPATPARKTEGTIYYLRVGAYYKIGWTSDLAKRMRQYPPDTRLLARHPGTRKDEAALHKRFAHHRTHGREWYPLATQITEHVNRMVKEHGEPDEVTFAARPTQVPRPHSDKPMVTPRNWTGGRHSA